MNKSQKSKASKGGSQLYKPSSKLAELAASFQDKQEKSNSESKQDKAAAMKKQKANEKRKSNLEIFKEELRRCVFVNCFAGFLDNAAACTYTHAHTHTHSLFSVFPLYV